MTRHFMAHPIVLTGVLVLSGAVALVIALVAYANHAEDSAKGRATEFCASVKVGENADALYERARSRGADERQTRWIAPPNQDRELLVTFTGFTPFSKHICWVKAASTVKSARYVYLD